MKRKKKCRRLNTYEVLALGILNLEDLKAHADLIQDDDEITSTEE